MKKTKIITVIEKIKTIVSEEPDKKQHWIEPDDLVTGLNEKIFEIIEFEVSQGDSTYLYKVKYNNAVYIYVGEILPNL